MSVVVTQADRQAAADLGVALGWQPDVIAAVREGRRDYWPTVRAFTRHRTEATEELLEACESMIPRNLCLTNSNVRDDTVVPLETTMGELRKIAAAIARARGEQA